MLPTTSNSLCSKRNYLWPQFLSGLGGSSSSGSIGGRNNQCVARRSMILIGRLIPERTGIRAPSVAVSVRFLIVDRSASFLPRPVTGCSSVVCVMRSCLEWRLTLSSVQIRNSACESTERSEYRDRKRAQSHTRKSVNPVIWQMSQ